MTIYLVLTDLDIFESIMEKRSNRRSDICVYVGTCFICLLKVLSLVMLKWISCCEQIGIFPIFADNILSVNRSWHIREHNGKEVKPEVGYLCLWWHMFYLFAESIKNWLVMLKWISWCEQIGIFLIFANFFSLFFVL